MKLTELVVASLLEPAAETAARAHLANDLHEIVDGAPHAAPEVRERRARQGGGNDADSRHEGQGVGERGDDCAMEVGLDMERGGTRRARLDGRIESERGQGQEPRGPAVGFGRGAAARLWCSAQDQPGAIADRGRGDGRIGAQHVEGALDQRNVVGVHGDRAGLGHGARLGAELRAGAAPGTEHLHDGVDDANRQHAARRQAADNEA